MPDGKLSRKRPRRLSEDPARHVPAGVASSDGHVQTAKLFKNGRSQAVRLPKDCRFEGDEVYVKRQGRVVTLMPKDDPWRELFEAASLWDHSVPFERDQPKEQQIRKSLDMLFPPRRPRRRSKTK
ncbi:MAG: antitoxin [Reyranellales bacterium]